MNDVRLRQTTSESAGSVLGRLADEYVTAQERGDPLAIDEFVARCPEHAAVIRDVFPVLGELHRSAVSKEKEPSGGEEMERTVILRNYRLLRELGRGGMGVVFEAEDLKLGRRVALKVLPLAATLDPRRRRRFQQEARAAAMVKHPHITSIYVAGNEGSLYYYVMELVQGISLADLVGPASLPADSFALCPLSNAPKRARQVAQLGLQAAEALHHAHRSGVVHRDIKPSNLLVDAMGDLWVTDFGLAHIQAEQPMTVMGDILGTLRYMSPEQLAGDGVVDQRTDVYSLGLTLYELLVGQPAFAASSRETLVRHVLEREPPALRAICPQLPRDLETIVLKAIAKDRAGRYGSAEELRDDLSRFLDHRPIRARRVSRVEALRQWSRRRPGVAALVGALACALVLLAIGGPLMAWRQTMLAAQARRHLYVADINLAYQAWYSGHVDRVDELLRKHASVTYGDSRDFSYQYLANLWKSSDASTLYRAQQPINAIAVSADDKLVACGGAFPGVRLIDALTGQLVRTLQEECGPCQTLAFSPNGKWLATNGNRTEIILWNTGTWRTGPKRLSHYANVQTIDFSPRGRRLVVGTEDGRLTAWSIDGKRQWGTAAHTRWSPHPAFSPDGRSIITVGEDHYIKLWNAETGELRHVVTRLKGRAFDAEFAGDGNHLFVSGEEGICLWDPETKTPLRGLHNDTLPIASLALKGNLLATGGHDQLLQFWDIHTGYRVGSIPAYRSKITSLAFTSDGERVFAGGGDGTLQFFHVTEFQRYQDHIASVDWDWATHLAITQDDTRCVSIAAPHNFGTSPDDENGQLIVWDVVSGEPRLRLPVSPRFGCDVAISSDARICASAGFGGLRLWDLTTGNPDTVLLKDDRFIFKTVAVSPDGRWVAAGGRVPQGGIEHALLLMFDLSLPLQAPRHLHPSNPFGAVFSLSFSDDGSKLAVARGDWTTGGVDLWTIANGEWCETASNIAQHDDFASDTAFVPGSQVVLSCGWEGVLGIRHLTDPRQSRYLRGHSQAIFSVASSHDGSLAAIGAGHEIRLWDQVTGDQLGSLSVPMWVSSLALTSDGRTLVWGGGDGTVHFERSRGLD